MLSARWHDPPVATFPVRNDGRRAVRYRLVSAASRGVLRGWLGGHLHVDAMAGIPEKGPLIVAANHLSNVDPFLFGGFGPGAMFAMAKRELFGVKPVSWVLLGCNVFPVDREGADRAAVATALRLVSGGGRLLVFVEGTRAHKPGMGRAEPGVGFLVRRTGAPVLPVGIWGTERVLGRAQRLPRRAEVNVRVGEPLLPTITGRGRAADQAVADSVGRAIAELLPARYRGVYGAG